MPLFPPVPYLKAIAALEDHHADHGDDTIDLDALDVQDMDQKMYTKIMGRWRKDATRALATKFFWARMHIVPRVTQVVCNERDINSPFSWSCRRK